MPQIHNDADAHAKTNETEIKTKTETETKKQTENQDRYRDRNKKILQHSIRFGLIFEIIAAGGQKKLTNAQTKTKMRSISRL